MYEWVLVGGGLQNALIALAIGAARPGARVALVERGPRLGGEHTWCFHAGDVPPEAAAFVEPLVVRRWDGYDVRFPGLARRLASPYACTTSARLHALLERAFRASPGSDLLLASEATEIGARHVRLADGRVLEAEAVVDARGPDVAAARGSAGYQKFVGRELELERPHGLDRPRLMDATVAQQGGFRFLYMLPLAPTTLLLEDTVFADSPELDRERLRAGVDAYAVELGLGPARVVREEEGVLPMPWAAPPPAPPRPGRDPLVAGYRGGWMHPSTGYSFPIAVRLATVLARTPPGPALTAALATLARDHARQFRFALRLNRLLFHWFLPERRRDVFARFHALPEATIRRFYALRTTRADRLRILLGRPPRGLSLRARLSVPERFLELACR